MVDDVIETNLRIRPLRNFSVACGGLLLPVIETAVHLDQRVWLNGPFKPYVAVEVVPIELFRRHLAALRAGRLEPWIRSRFPDAVKRLVPS